MFRVPHTKYPVRMSVHYAWDTELPTCTKLDVTVNRSCLLVWAVLGTQLQGQGKKYCLSLLVQEMSITRIWNVEWKH